MLNNKASVLALCAALFISNVYAAHGTKDKWYLGLDMQRNFFPKSGALKDALNGASIFGGYRWDMVSAELGTTIFQRVHYTGTVSSGGRTVIGVDLRQKMYNYFFDAAYYFPLATDFELKASLGVGLFNTKFSGNAYFNSNDTIYTSSGSTSQTTLCPRVGLGFGYNIDEHFSANITYRFQWIDKVYDSMQTVAIGFAYHF